MSGRSKTLISAAVMAVIFGFLGYLIARDWQELSEIDWWQRPEMICLHLALLASVFLLFVKSWQIAVIGMGSACTLGQAGHTWLLPNLGKYLPGKVLMFAGRVELCHRQGMSRGAAIATVILEHVVIILAATPFLVIALFSDLTALDSGYLTGFGLLLLCGGVAIVLRPAGLRWLLERMAKVLRRDLSVVPADGLALRLLPLYLLLWLVYGLSGYVLIHALGFGSSVPVLLATTAFVAAWEVGFLSFLTPGGLGVREATLVGLLSPYLSVSEATTVALLARVSWTLVEMLGAGIGVWNGGGPIASRAEKTSGRE